MSDAYKQWLTGPEAAEILRKAAFAKWDAMSATEKAPFEVLGSLPSRTAMPSACGPQFFLSTDPKSQAPQWRTLLGRTSLRCADLSFFEHGCNRS